PLGHKPPIGRRLVANYDEHDTVAAVRSPTQRKGPLPDTANPPDTEQETAVTVERRGQLLLMGLNRPAKRNAFNLAMIDQLAAAYHDLEADDDVRCGVLFARGEHFRGGLARAR